MAGRGNVPSNKPRPSIQGQAPSSSHGWSAAQRMPLDLGQAEKDAASEGGASAGRDRAMQLREIAMPRPRCSWQPRPSTNTATADSLSSLSAYSEIEGREGWVHKASGTRDEERGSRGSEPLRRAAPSSKQGTRESLAFSSTDGEALQEKRQKLEQWKDTSTPWGIVGFAELGYVLEEWFGTGTFGRAVRQADGCSVAVQTLPSDSKSHRRAAREEFELLSSLSHSAVIQAEVLYETKYDVWLCVEWCPDGSVRGCVGERGPVGEPRGAGLAAQLFEGLAYLHGAGVAHCALSPDHLMLKGDGAVLKISAFGSAKRIRELGKFAGLGDGGSPLYAAPEMMRPGSSWNELVDVWAGGLCAYYIVCGRLPFYVTDAHSRACILAERIPDIEWEGISEELRELLRQCLVVDAQRRAAAATVVAHPALRQQRTEVD